MFLLLCGKRPKTITFLVFLHSDAEQSLKKLCNFDLGRRYFQSEMKRKTCFSFAFRSLNRNFAGRNHKNKTNMTAVLERTPRRITVSMSTRRWNRMLQLEETYKLARIIKRSMKQVELEPSMTPEQAVEALRAL